MKSQSWSQITDALVEAAGWSNVEYQKAAASIADIAKSIAESELGNILFGWTSMESLCVQQIDVSPASGPYLRLTPLSAGRVEFRYIDSMIASRQWCRVVDPADAAQRFSHFIADQRWAAI